MTPPRWSPPSPETRAAWLAEAGRLTPALIERRAPALCLVETVADAAAFQGWRVARIGAFHAVPLAPGRPVRVDFGEHLVGRVALRLRVTPGVLHSPFRFRVKCAEAPAEFAEPWDPFQGGLSRAWLQDDVFNLDVIEAETVLPRRYTLRFLEIEALATDPYYQVELVGVDVLAVSSAAHRVEPVGLDDELRAIDSVALRTLANCMQTVFEDGPKRDRRLWLGDLRLQARANALTFQNHALTKRCLLMFAAFQREDGAVPACVYEKPRLHSGGQYILDYALLLGPALLDDADASGDSAVASALTPLALRQIDLACAYLDDEGVFAGSDWWEFIDWHEQLDKQASEHGVLLYAVHAGIELARRAALSDEVDRLTALQARLFAGAARLRDPETGLFVSGPERQISWASQIWMVLGGAVGGSEATNLLRRVMVTPEALKPNGPYLMHHAVEALWGAGLGAEALALLRKYWGGMIRRGADTFWEVFDPQRDRLSPYGNHHLNSYCHAWSCTPSWFLRAGLV